MKLHLEIDVVEGSYAEQAVTTGQTLIRFSQGLGMLGIIPALVPLYAPNGVQIVGRAWLSDTVPAEVKP